MTYQPNLFVRNIGNASVVKVYDLLKELGFGMIDHLKVDTIKDEKCVFIKMQSWNLNLTTATRIKLQEGNPLSIYHSENEYWKVFSYENRFSEETQQAKQEAKQHEKLRIKNMKRKYKDMEYKIRQREQREQFRRQQEKENIKMEEREEIKRQLERELDEELEEQNESEKEYDTPAYVTLDYTYSKEIYPKLISKYRSVLKSYKKTQ